MTYEPKFPQCPYMTSNRKCVHKCKEFEKAKKRRVCGYGDPKECEMYCEWNKELNVEQEAPESL